MEFTIFFNIALFILTVISIALFHIPIALWVGLSWRKVSRNALLSKKVKKIIHGGLMVCSIFIELLIIPSIIIALSYIYPFFHYEKPADWILCIITFTPVFLNVALLFDCVARIAKNTDSDYSNLINRFEEYKEKKVNLQKQIEKYAQGSEERELADQYLKNINDIAVMYNERRKYVSSSILPMKLEYVEIVNDKIQSKL